MFVMDFIIHKVNQFNKHKLNLINLINKIPQTTCNSDNEKISHTDYKIPQTMKREYVDYFVNNIYGDYYDNLKSINKVNVIGFRNIWFQVYNKGDWHGSHTHPGTHFTNVLYVNLPNKNLKTFLKKPNGEVFNFDAEEGDLITFPAYYEHSSPENKSNEQKIIISFNIDIQSYKY
tara:strand:+ start:60 stop:584 length:525 start_codon:yes stop_codon:yes gene_type:complete